MRKLPYFRNLIAFLFASALIVSCTTDVDWETKINNLKFDQTIVLPIGDAKVTLSDLFSEIDTAAMVKSEDVHFYLSLKDSADWDIKLIPSLGSTVPTQLDFNPLVGTDEGTIRSLELSPYELDLDVNSDINTQRLDSIIANSAKIGISVSVENAVVQPSDIKIIFNFNRDRVKFSNGSTKQFFTPTAFTQTEELFMDASSIYLPNATSKVPLSLRIEIKKDGTVFSNNSKVTINFKYTQINTKVIYGYFQPELSSTTQEKVIDISDFTKELPKNIKLKFTEPEIEFETRSNLGVKVGFYIDELKAYLASDETKIVKANFDGSDSKLITLNRKNKYEDQPASTNYTMNNTVANGSLQKLFSADFIPDRLRYKYHVDNQGVNNYPNPTVPADFYAPGVPFRTYIYVKLPLKFAGGSYAELTDSITDIKIDTANVNDKYIETAQLLIKITNKFPVKIKLTLKFLSSTSEILDLGNVFDIPEIPTTTTDVNGVVTGTPSPVTIKIDVNNEKISELTKLNKIVYTVRADSKDSASPIIFHKDNSIEIKAGIFAKGKATLKSIR